MDPKTGKEMVIEFRLWGAGLSLPNSNGRQIRFTGTMTQVFEEMKRYYIEAGSPPYSHIIADYWCGCQIRFPKRN